METASGVFTDTKPDMKPSLTLSVMLDGMFGLADEQIREEPPVVVLEQDGMLQDAKPSTKDKGGRNINLITLRNPKKDAETALGVITDTKSIKQPSLTLSVLSDEMF